jgi:hypothetical protein
MFRSLGANIWDHDANAIRRDPVVAWLHGMTVIRFTSGDLVVHSPTRLDLKDLTSQGGFQKLGPIVAIIPPSWWHDA